jgi:hypothetical protein
MICELCGETFEGQGFRVEIDPHDENFERVVDYKKCKGCGSGMIIYHPYFPVQPHQEQEAPPNA